MFVLSLYIIFFVSLSLICVMLANPFPVPKKLTIELTNKITVLKEGSEGLLSILIGCGSKSNALLKDHFE